MARLSYGRVWLLLLVLTLLSACAGTPSHAQPDSVRAQILKERGFSADHTPRGALWRAAVVPGWGQFYNRQYLKLPFVYAGLAGGVFTVSVMNQHYLLYQHANLFKIGQNQAGEGGQNEYQHFQDDYDEVVRRVGGELSGDQLRNARDKFRRWRDLAIVGTGVFYALTILDAYVSAHLLAFDVGGVALNVRPTGPVPVHTSRIDGRNAHELPRPGAPGRTGVRIRVRF